MTAQTASGGPVLVTGGAGFIGSHTCKALAQSGYLPVTFDNLSRGRASNVKWGPLRTGDILDPEALDAAFTTYKPRSVIHFAALAYVSESVVDPLSYYQVNVAGLVNVLTAMRTHAVELVVLSSSCATYGIPDTIPVREEAPQHPISPYGRSKLMCEQVLIDAAAAHGFRYAILRYFNACGADPEGELVEEHSPETHLVPLAIDAATGKGAELQVFGSDYETNDGTCERDSIHATDLAHAHVLALEHLRERASVALNVGTGRAYSVLEVLRTVEAIVGRPVPKCFASRCPGDPQTAVADPSASEKVLGFRARYSDLQTIVHTAWRTRSATAGPDQ